jgi:hypothetical protein
MVPRAYVQVFRGYESGESLRGKTLFHLCENIARFPDAKYANSGLYQGTTFSRAASAKKRPFRAAAGRSASRKAGGAT